MMIKKEKIELLNSEGPILVAYDTEDGYVIYDREDSIVDILTKEEMIDFIHNDSPIINTDGKEMIYSTYPGSMKPDLKELDEFIGINTENKKY